MWLRDSSLVAVRQVTVLGAHGHDAGAIRTSLTQAARAMTTLHLRRRELREAVAAYPVVKDLRVSVRLPRRVRIVVVQHVPVAAAVIDGRPVPVAADGTLLPGESASGGLTPVPVSSAPGTRLITDRRTLGELALLGAAPAALRPLVTDVVRDGDGMHVRLESGPRVDFGPASGLRAKWVAAARVLADPRAVGASYVDVRLPQRPVAGSFPGEPVVGSTAADATAPQGAAAG